MLSEDQSDETLHDEFMGRFRAIMEEAKSNGFCSFVMLHRLDAFDPDGIGTSGHFFSGNVYSALGHLEIILAKVKYGIALNKEED